MSKNMTRKGLAFGAGFALIATGFAGAPATAAVDDNAVSLIPRTGTEYGGFIDNVFDLETTSSLTAASGSGNVKYLVSDPDEELRFDFDGDTGTNSDSATTKTESDLEDGANNRTDLKITGAGTATATVELRFASDPGYTEGDVITITNTTAVSDIALDIDDLTGVTVTVVAAETTPTTDTIRFANSGDDTFADLENGDSITLASLTGGGFDGTGTDEVADLDGTHTISGVVDNDNDGYAEQFDISVDTDKSKNATDTLTGGTLDSGPRTDTLDSDAEAAIDGTHEITAVDATTNGELIRFVVDDTAGDLANVTGLANTSDITNIDIAEVTQKTDALDDRSLIVNSDVPFGNTGLTGLATPSVDSDGVFVIDTGSSASASDTNILRLVSTSTDTHSVDVTAWIDENGNGEIDPTENSSSTRTVTFYKWSASGAQLNIENPVPGEDWEVYVSFNDDINASQITSGRLGVFLGVLDNGTLEDASAGTTTPSNGVFTTTTDSLNWDSSSHVEDYWGLKVGVVSDLAGLGSKNEFVAGFTYVAQIELDDSAFGPVVYSGIGAPVADTVGAIEATIGPNVNQSSNDVKVRTDYTGDVEFSIELEESDSSVADGSSPVPAGTVVTVEVDEDTLSSDSAITVNGETIESGDDAVEFEVLTNSEGVASFTLSNSEGASGDDIDITMTTGNDTKLANVTWGDPTDATMVISGSTVATIEAEQDVVLTYAAFDEFGAPLTSPDYRLEVIYYEDVAQTLQKTTGVTLDSNGIGTITIEDASESVGTYPIEADLQELQSDASYSDITASAADEVDTTVYVVSDMTAANITLDATGDGSVDNATPEVELEDPAVKDHRRSNSGEVPGYDDDNEYTISGLVTTASGSPVRGESVTIAGDGLLFNTGALNSSTAQNYTVDSITVTTTVTGSYSAEVRSNVAGEHEITVTSGGATETETIEFNDAVETAGTNLALSAPESAEPGSTFTVIATLTDKFGNPVETNSAGASNVDFTMEYDGPGVALSTPVDTNSNGEAKFAVLLGSNDSGSATITVSYDADDTSTTLDDNYSQEATVVIGDAPSDQKVNAGSFKGYVAVYALGYEGQRLSAKIGNDWVIVDPIVNNESDNLFRVTDFTGAGVDIAVRIYIDRVLVDTIPLVTK